MVSTRLQSNNSSVLNTLDVNSSKLTSNIGCVTRSNTTGNTHQISHSKDIHSKPLLNLLDLPTEIIEKIVSYCEYRTVANMRIVIINVISFIKNITALLMKIYRLS